MIDFGDPVRSVKDCIEQLSTSRLVHNRMVSLFFVKKLLTGLAYTPKIPARAQLPWLPDEMLKEELLL